MKMKNKKVLVQDWGLLDYQQAWDRQEQVFAETVQAKTLNRNNNTVFDSQALTALVNGLK